MYQTNYHRASSVSDATARVKGAEEPRFLSGGQTLIPAMKQRLAAPSDLVDVSRIEDLRGISVADGVVTVGAATTHAEIADHAELAAAIPALSQMAGSVGDAAVRARGTMGGAVANNDPAQDYPCACLALNATIVTDRREMAAEAFFTGMFETALEEGELVTRVRFPVPGRAGYAKFRNPASRYAMAAVMVAQTDAGVRAAVTGAGNDGVFRHAAMEEALSSDWSAAALADVTTPEADMLSDIHATAAYRAHLVSVMGRRAVEES